MYAGGQQPALGVEADLELREEGMAMAGDDHVLVPIKANTDGMAGVSRGQGRQRRGQSGLGFFAAESAAHARALNDNFIVRKMQHVRDDGLDFRGMLRGG